MKILNWIVASYVTKNSLVHVTLYVTKDNLVHVVSHATKESLVYKSIIQDKLNKVTVFRLVQHHTMR